MASSHIIYLILFLKKLILINEIKSFKSKIYKINYMMERRMSWKLSCTVWVGGKSRDNFKKITYQHKFTVFIPRLVRPPVFVT